MIGLSGCAGGDGASNENNSGDGDETQYGILSTTITDQPNDIDDFEELIVTIDGIWLKPAEGDEGSDGGDQTDSMGTEAGDQSETGGNETVESETETPTTEEPTESADGDGEVEDEATGESEVEATGESEVEATGEVGGEESEGEDDSGRYYVEFEEAQQANLVELQGPNTALIDETELAAREYQFLQLDVSDTTGVLAESGEEADVETPGNAPLKFNQRFEIRPDEETQFIADFAPNRTGQGRYIIRPVASGTQVLYGDEEYEPGGGGESTSEEADADGGGGNNSGPGGDDGDGGPGGDDGNSGPDGDDGNGGSGGDGSGGDGETTTLTETPA
jgi:hypothetical protein